MEQPADRKAYLLRLWPRRSQGAAGCRVSLESVATGRRRELPDLQSLIEYLQSQLEPDAPGNTGP